MRPLPWYYNNHFRNMANKITSPSVGEYERAKLAWLRAWKQMLYFHEDLERKVI